MNDAAIRSLPPAVVLACAMTLAAGCAPGPRFDSSTYSRSPTPAEAVHDAETLQSAPLLWGGAILNSVNQERQTKLEVLGYPLGSAQRPDVSREAIGRFIVLKDEYLETIDYAPGRMVTVTGEFASTQEGMVGDATYTYPVIEADQIYLWPAEGAELSEPRFNIGVGIMLGN